MDPQRKWVRTERGLWPSGTWALKVPAGLGFWVLGFRFRAMRLVPFEMLALGCGLRVLALLFKNYR